MMSCSILMYISADLSEGCRVSLKPINNESFLR